MSKDRNGLEYADLVKIQGQHLALWREKLKPALIGPVADYVVSKNTEANDPEQKHRVFRGQDLVQIIMDWPDINTAVYPPIHEEPAAAADLI